MKSNEKITSFFTKVFLWMFIGLLFSGITAYYTAKTPSMINFVSSYFMFIILLELVVVIVFSFLRKKVSPSVAKILFIIYSVISGLTLSSIFIVYKLNSILFVFLASALLFGLLALYGYVTKQDLTSFGKLMFFGLIAVIIMSIINMFVTNSVFGIVVSIISIIVFLGLTAWDMKKLKSLYYEYENDEDELDKVAIY